MLCDVFTLNVLAQLNGLRVSPRVDIYDGDEARKNGGLSAKVLPT